MPIRINLLAEMQALEELRRRDPVKRTIFVGAGLMAVIVVWITSLMLAKISSKGELANLEQKIQSSSTSYSQVLDNQKNLVEGHQKLTSLSQISTNRFLMGNLMDSLQKSTVANVQLTRFKIDQSYVATEAVKAGTNSDTGAPTAGKPATIIEHTTLTLIARDNSTVPGDSIGRFQSALSHNPFLHSLISNRTNDFRLVTSLTPQSDPDGKTFVAFTLEAHLTDKTR